MSARSESLERTQRFDYWVAQVEFALQDTNVALQLGRLGIALRNANKAAFLPNVHGNQVIVPKSQRDVDSFAILPRLPTDGMLHAHPTLLQPTPYRKKLMNSQLEQANYHAENENVIARLIREALKNTPKEDSERLINPNDGLPVHTSAVYHELEEPTSVLFSSRQIITIEPHYSFSVPDALKAAMGAHSLLGALDGEMYQQIPGELTKFRTELRGNRINFLILKRALEDGRLFASDLKQHGDLVDVVFEIERQREAHGINADELLRGKLAINERLRDFARFVSYNYYH